MNNQETIIPNTPSELVKQNQEPLSPETIWEEYKKLGVKEQEIFILNCVSQMKEFHHYVVNEMMEDESKSKEDVGIWIQDGTKWSEIMRILSSMDM